MLIRTRLAFLALGLASGLVLAGCNGATPPANNAATGTTGGGHTHTHLGPHKGHVMVLGKEEYHAEWTHTEEGKVTFYIDVKINANPTETHTLAAANPVDGKTAAFEISNSSLETALEQIKSPGVVCTLHVNINGKQFDQEIKEEEHTDDHGK